MLQSRNTFIDFDGTLVIENSSRLLIDVLAANGSSWHGSVVNWALASRLAYPLRGAIGVIGRLSGERDMTLYLVLWIYRRTLATRSQEVFDEVARRLTVNESLTDIYTKPFSIASAGLAPIIRSFLALHPEIQCQEILASVVLVSGRSSVEVQLWSLKAKMRRLQMSQPTVYYTDYHREMKLFQRQAVARFTQETLTDSAGRHLFKLELQP